VICSVNLAAKEILLLLDGRALEPVRLPEDFKLEIIGSDEEAKDKKFTFTNYSNGQTFHGCAANLKVFGQAFSAAEIKELAAANVLEKPTFEPPVKKR
jgi:hypothetical protein